MNDKRDSEITPDVNDYSNNVRPGATVNEANSPESEISHTPTVTGHSNNLAAAGFLPVSGALGGNPAGLIGSNTAVSAPLFTGPAAYNVVAPLTSADDGNQQLAQTVENALAEEPTLSAGTLAGLRIAASSDGVIELSGTADSEHDRVRAEAVAARLAGVSQVVNRLSVS